MIRDEALDAPVAVAAVLASLGLLILGNAIFGPGLALWQLALIQLGCIAAPGILAAKLFAPRGVAQAIGSRWPRPRTLLGAALIGASFWVVLVWLVVPLSVQIFGIEEAERLAERWFDGEPLWWRIAVLAALPAVAEEILFRGVLARALAARYPAASAVALSALVFALYHLSPARFLPTFALGVVLAFVTLRSRSILPAMVIHGLGNAAALIAAQRPSVDQILAAQRPSVDQILAAQRPSVDQILAAHPHATGLAALAMCAVGALLIAPPVAHSGSEPKTSP